MSTYLIVPTADLARSDAQPPFQRMYAAMLNGSQAQCSSKRAAGRALARKVDGEGQNRKRLLLDWIGQRRADPFQQPRI